MRPLLTAFLAGSLLIVGIRLVWSGEAGAVVAALAAVAVVFGLGAHYKRSGAKARDRAGDDLYYVGLLLTLVSLIYTLIALFILQAGDAAQRMDELIGNFGIALVSTVAGILGRIILQDGEAPPPVDEEEDKDKEDANRAVLEELAALRRHLREASNAFVHFTVVTSSHAQGVKTQTEQLMEDFNAHIVAVAHGRLNETATAWREAADAVRADGERLVAGVGEGVTRAVQHAQAAADEVGARVGATVESALRQVQAAHREVQTVQGQLAAASGAIAALTERLNGASEHVEGFWQRLRDEATDAFAATKTLADEARTAQENALRKLETNGAGLQEAMAEQARASRALFEELAATGREQVDAVAAIRGSMTAMAVNLEAAQRGVGMLGDAAAKASSDVAAGVPEALDRLNAAVAELGAGQQDAIEPWRAAIADFRGMASQFAAAMEDWRRGVEAANAALPKPAARKGRWWPGGHPSRDDRA